MQLFAGGHKGHSLAKLGVISVPNQQRLAVVVELGHDVLLGGVTRDAQHPFRVKGRRDPPATFPHIFQAQLNHLDRRVLSHKESQLLFEAMAVVLENRITGAVSDQVGRWRAGRLQRRRPDLRRFFVAQVERLARRIGHRIIRPRSEPVFAAVD